MLIFVLCNSWERRIEKYQEVEEKRKASVLQIFIPFFPFTDNQCGLFDNNSSGLLPIEDTCGSLERMIQSNRNFFLDDISRSSAAMS